MYTLFTEPCQESYSEAYRVWEECRKTSKSVEVVYKNVEEEEVVTRINFKFDPKVCTILHMFFVQYYLYCLMKQNAIREELIETVKLRINRNSAKDKLRDFLEWMKVVKRDITHDVSHEYFLST